MTGIVQQQHAEIELRPGVRFRCRLLKLVARPQTIDRDAPTILITAAKHVDAVEIARLRSNSKPAERGAHIAFHAVTVEQHLTERHLCRGTATGGRRINDPGNLLGRS